MTKSENFAINTVNFLRMFRTEGILVAAAVDAGEISGWRGDGSGHYPDANPPLDWGRIATCVTELSAQAHKPKDGTAPTSKSAMPDGVIRRWLVLGPLPIG